jgi:hypothetical protein
MDLGATITRLQELIAKRDAIDMELTELFSGAALKAHPYLRRLPSGRPQQQDVPHKVAGGKLKLYDPAQQVWSRVRRKLKCKRRGYALTGDDIRSFFNRFSPVGQTSILSQYERLPKDFVRPKELWDLPTKDQFVFIVACLRGFLGAAHAQIKTGGAGRPSVSPVGDS